MLLAARSHDKRDHVAICACARCITVMLVVSRGALDLPVAESIVESLPVVVCWHWRLVSYRAGKGLM